MAGLTGNVPIAPGAGIAVCGEVVALLEIRRVAVGALVIPGLIAPRPVQAVSGPQFLVGVEMEPALPALLLWAAVPGDTKRLESPAGHRDQVLL